MSSPGRGRTKLASRKTFPIFWRSRSMRRMALMQTASASSSTKWALRAHSRRHRKAQGGAEGHACAALMPSDAWRRPARCRYLPLPLGLDLIPDQCGRVRPTEILHGANARRRGDVDFGQISADYVDADEEEPTLAQGLSDASTDLAVARREFRFVRNAAADHVGPQIIGRRHPVHCPGELTIDQEDA